MGPWLPGGVSVAVGCTRAGGQPMNIQRAWGASRDRRWVGYLAGRMVGGLLATGGAYPGVGLAHSTSPPHAGIYFSH